MADAYWSDVALLCSFDGSDTSTTFTDESANGYSLSAVGNAQLDTAEKKFGTASLLCDGSGDAVKQATAANWKFLHVADAKWTVECWVKTSTFTASQTIIDTNRGSSSAVGARCYINGTDRKLKLYLTNGSLAVISMTSTTAYPNDGAWHHIAFTYDHTAASNNAVVYVDGTSYGSANKTANAPSANNPTYGLGIGGTDAGGTPFNGWLDEIRITKVVRYTEDFEAPSAPFESGSESTGTGVLVSAAAVVFGEGWVNGERTGSGALASQPATISGVGFVPQEWTGTGVLASQSASVAASGFAITTPTGAGALAAQPSSVSGTGGLPVEPSLPISMNVLLPVVVGLPIRIDIYSAVTPSLPITIGPYPVTPTLPITFKTPVAVTLPSVTITFPGSYAAVASNLLTWSPKCVLDGTDISGKLIGAQDIEFEEDGAPVATFSFIPAAGTVDPLLYVGKRVTLSISIGGATYLAFSGIVSDPIWNADDRTITISATGDLQSRLDAMAKTAILAQLGGTFSEYVFDDPNNLSGFEYAEALISTQPKVLWQDANGLIRATSILAKATADYTFAEADILDTAHVVRWAGRMDIINTLRATLSYRYGRRRERRMTFNFRPYQLETPSTYLSGNEGGWELPQRQQIASAADGGGWTVIGDITYMPVWTNGYYSTYSDSGTPMMEGLSITPEVAADLCIGARWTAAKRWLQTVTEEYTLQVTASDSIEAVGVLATDESYAIEDDATDEAWESSLDYDDYVSGAVAMANGVDKRADLDELRDDVTAAMAVALAKAQNDVLKSHRGTTVSFITTYDPRIDLSHTIAVDTDYLDCKGKVRRIAHHWDITTADATTEIEVALSRHNGSGLASSDTLTPPSEPAEPTETKPSTYHNLEMHIGGQSNFPKWSESFDGYIVNVPFSETAGNNTLLGSWERNPANPQAAPRVYEEGFHILPPEIAAQYADPAAVTAASSYDVAVPEDPLTLISG